MKTSAVTLLFMVLSTFAISQQESTIALPERNTIYAEAFGQGFFGSLNYDRLMNTDSKVMNSFTAGFIFAPKSAGFGDGMYLGIPVSYNWLLGKKNHHLELGVGFTLLATEDFSGNRVDNFYTYLTPKIGYRYQRPGGGLFLRANFSPMIALMNVNSVGDGVNYTRFFNDIGGIGYRVFPWPGLSIGYTF